MTILATIGPEITQYLQAVQILNSETSPEMFAAELYLFFGGVLLAFVMGAYSMVIRATKGASREIDL